MSSRHQFISFYMFLAGLQINNLNKSLRIFLGSVLFHEYNFPDNIFLQFLATIETVVGVFPVIGGLPV